MTLHVHKEVTERLSVSEIENEFVGPPEHHLILFGSSFQLTSCLEGLTNVGAVFHGLLMILLPPVISIIKFNINMHNGETHKC